MFLLCAPSGGLVESQWCLCFRSWSCCAISKALSVPMLTTATHTATCTTAGPVPGWSGPSNCCMETPWIPSGRPTTTATWLSGARSRKRWVKGQPVQGNASFRGNDVLMIFYLEIEASDHYSSVTGSRTPWSWAKVEDECKEDKWLVFMSVNKHGVIPKVLSYFHE